MKSLCEKIISSIDYKTYKKIKKCLLGSAYGTCVTGTLLNFGSIPFCGYVSGLSVLLFCLSLVYDSKSGNNTRDVIEIRNLYQEFINNYSKLNKTFGLDEPISIYAMYMFLLGNGYLSKDKKYIIENNYYNCFDSIRGAEVINGVFVCRHASSLFTDILNNENIDALNVVCSTYEEDYDVFDVSENEYSRKKNIKFVNKYIECESERKKILDELDLLCDDKIYLELRLTSEKNKIYRGNHSITYALYNGKNYYLDPIQGRILNLSDRNNGVLYDGDGKMKIVLEHTRSFNRDCIVSNYNKLYKGMLIPNNYLCDNESNANKNNIISFIFDTCIKNLDVFQQFYKDNSQLYDEISNKLIKLRKK